MAFADYAVLTVYFAAIAMVANIVLNLALMGPLGLRGLALATSLAAFLNVALLVAHLGRRVGPLPRAAMTRALGRTVVASVALGAGCAGGLAAAAALLPGDAFIARLGAVVASIAAGLVCLVVAYRLLGHREMAEILESLPGRGR